MRKWMAQQTQMRRCASVCVLTVVLMVTAPPLLAFRVTLAPHFAVKPAPEHTRRHFAVFTSAGDKSNVQQWIRTPRTYDTLLAIGP
jgi:hypothetical protein